VLLAIAAASSTVGGDIVFPPPKSAAQDEVAPPIDAGLETFNEGFDGVPSGVLFKYCIPLSLLEGAACLAWTPAADATDFTPDAFGALATGTPRLVVLWSWYLFDVLLLLSQLLAPCKRKEVFKL
jgi:hypothetical protein